MLATYHDDYGHTNICTVLMTCLLAYTTLFVMLERYKRIGRPVDFGMLS